MKMPKLSPIRAYDNGGKTADRYTLVRAHCAARADYPRHGRLYAYAGASENPYHPQGFGQHGESEHAPIDRPTSRHLGRRVKLESLPPDVQRLAASLAQ